MKNSKKIISLTLIAIFTLIMTLNNIPSKATTKTTDAKAQIIKATAAVIKAENAVKAINFDPVAAQKQLDIATKEVSKIKLLEKKYIGNYTALSKRNIEISKKISNRNLAIKKEEAEQARMAEEAEKTRLIEEAKNKVLEAEKIINSDNINMMESNAEDLANAQDAITTALEAVSKLDRTSEIYKSLMDRIDAVYVVVDKVVDKVKEDNLAMKPVIYLYPTIKQNLNVKIGDNVSLSCSYPEYSKDGWNITAYPDGTIIDKKTGRQYYCLYWEGIFKHSFNMSYGFVVEGKNIAEFLEDKLKKLGLTDREANEFIIYWLPKLEKNKYNLIHFATEEYSKQAPLRILPKPDSLIRILMVYKPLSKPVTVIHQQLITPVRKGFTAVEWGGMKAN